MEQADRDGASRSQHIVYTAPRTIEALGRIVTPPLERANPDTAALQVVILTPDSDTALAIADLAATVSGGALTFVPVTTANRAARLLGGPTAGPAIQAVAGTPAELHALVQRNLLKLDQVHTLVFAWADDILASGPESVAALESFLADIPKDAARALLARTVDSGVEQLIERYLRKARRMDEPVEDVDTSELQLRYVPVSATSRVIALQRLLDEIDPPSATILVRTTESQATVRDALRRLGYKGNDAPIRVALDQVTDGTHLIVFFDAPVSAAAIAAAAAAKPAELVALLTPKELLTVRELVGTVSPLPLGGPAHAARARDRALRDELAKVLTRGVPSREVLALEPLLEQFDGAEIAAAALRLLERERERTAELAMNASTATASSASDRAAPSDRPRRDSAPRPKRDDDDRPKRSAADRPAREFSDRPKRDFADRPKRDFSDRPKREFSDRPKREFSDRPKREFSDRPKRDFSDRPKRDFGAKREFGEKREFGTKREFGAKRGFGPKRDGGGKPGFGPKRGGDSRSTNRYGRDR